MKGIILGFLTLFTVLSFSGCKLVDDTFSPQTSSGPPKWESFTTSNSGLLSNDVFSVDVDVQSREWFGTNIGVSMLNKNVWTSFSSGTPLGAQQVNAITMGRDGAIWLGTGGGGVFRYSQNDPYKVWIPFGPSSGIPDGWIYSMAVNEYGDIWIGTNGGVGHFVQSIDAPHFTGTWTSYTTDNGLPDDHITTIAVDQNGIVWVGTSQAGLASFDGSNWTADPIFGNNIYRITSIAVDHNNNLWVASWDGLFKYDGSTWTHYDTSNGLPSNVLTCVAAGTNNDVWVGSASDGASLYNGKSWTTFDTQNSGIVYNSINAITVDTYGNVWFATPGGVSAYVYNSQGITN